MAKKQNSSEEQQMPKNSQSDNEFPGYPHYDKKEDIMDGRSDTERVDINVEGLPAFHNATTAHRLNGSMEQEARNADDSTDTGNEMEEDLGIEMGNEADVTAEEKKMLEDDMYLPTEDEDRLRQARLDDTDFDGEKLNEDSFGSGAESGDGLDMEGDGSSNDAMDEGDEENQYFSLGGDKDDGNVESES